MVVGNLTEKDDIIGKLIVQKDSRRRKEGWHIVSGQNKREYHDCSSQTRNAKTLNEWSFEKRQKGIKKLLKHRF